MSLDFTLLCLFWCFVCLCVRVTSSSVLMSLSCRCSAISSTKVKGSASYCVSSFPSHSPGSGFIVCGSEEIVSKTIESISWLYLLWWGSDGSGQDKNGVISFLKWEKPRPILSLTSSRCLVKVTNTAIVMTFFFSCSSRREQIALLAETYGHLHVLFFRAIALGSHPAG